MKQYNYYTDENGNSIFPAGTLQAYHVIDELRASEESGERKGYGNIGIALRIQEHVVNYELLEVALNRVINENDQLRSVCVRDGDTICQKIISKLDFHLDVVEAQGNNTDEKMKWAMAYSQSELMKPMDFFNDVMYRIFVIKIADDDNILVIVVQHWMGDGTSINVIFNSTMKYYLHPDSEDIAPPKFIDYIKEQNEFLESDAGKAQIEYWEKQLAGYEPYDFDSIDFGEADNGSDKVFIISLNLIESVAKKYKVTRFNVFHLALHVAISLYTGKYDTVIGATSANRTMKYINTVGFFAKPVLVRLKINSDNDKLSDLLAESVKTFSKGLSNLKALNRTDIIQITSPYQNFIARGEKIYNEIKTSKLNITGQRGIKIAALPAIENEDKLVVAAMGHGSIITDHFVNTLKDYINMVLEVMSSDTEATVADVKSKLL